MRQRLPTCPSASTASGRPALRVPADVIAAALAGLDPAVLDALRESIRRARLVHEVQRRTDVVIATADGGTVTQRWVPVDRVGLYVPGGQAVYPSSVVMNVVPAQVAGVRSLVVASPPQREHGGWPHPAILAACALLGVDEVLAVGGAQAVALLAYGAAADSGGEDVRAGGHDHRARATSTSLRPSASSRESSARTPRPARPRS